jgi:hypothetical protein
VRLVESLHAAARALYGKDFELTAASYEVVKVLHVQRFSR